MDFSRLVGLAGQHGVRVPLVHGLNRLDWEGVPDRERKRLEAFRRSHLVRTLSLAEELARVAGRFRTAGVPFVVFKGAALSVSLYGDLAAREYNDNDFLVPEERVDEAERVLAELGYRGMQGDRAFRRTFLASLRQFAFAHPDVDASVDLHWDFTGAHLPFPLAGADVWTRLEPVSIAGVEMPTLSVSDLALLLSGHGTKESWRCLIWVCDFATLLAHSKSIDWVDIHARAQQRGCGNAVLLACVLADSLLGVPVPAALAGAARNERVQALAARLAAPMPSGVPERMGTLADIDLCDRARDKAKAAVQLALARSVGDYESLPLPQSLWGAYYVTRPFRLAGRALWSGLRSAVARLSLRTN
jgi:hypothetical protein